MPKTKTLSEERLDQVNQLRIASQFPTIKADPFILKTILTHLELGLLKLLIRNECPLHTRKLYMENINSVLADQYKFTPNRMEFTEALRKLPKKVFSKYKLNPSQVEEGISIEIQGYDVMRKTILKNTRMLKGILNGPDGEYMKKWLLGWGGVRVKGIPYFDKSASERLRIKETALRSLRIPFPTYLKIYNHLDRLRSYGLVVKIPVEEGVKSKSNLLWALHPRFTSEFKDLFPDILKL